MAQARRQRCPAVQDGIDQEAKASPRVSSSWARMDHWTPVHLLACILLHGSVRTVQWKKMLPLWSYLSNVSHRVDSPSRRNIKLPNFNGLRPHQTLIVVSIHNNQYSPELLFSSTYPPKYARWLSLCRFVLVDGAHQGYPNVLDLPAGAVRYPGIVHTDSGMDQTTSL